MTGRDSQPVPGTRTGAANDNPPLFNARIGEGLRIGIASEGDPGDLRIRSGPAGITRGLSELGQDAPPISLLPSGNALRA
jgi:hypothetical protein